MQQWCSVFEIICSEALFDMENCSRKLEMYFETGKGLFCH